MTIRNNPTVTNKIKTRHKNKIRKNPTITTAHTIKKLNNKTDKFLTNLKGRRSKSISILLLIRNRLDTTTVIPAKAGIQTAFVPLKTKIHWIPAYAGMTIFFPFAEITTCGLVSKWLR